MGIERGLGIRMGMGWDEKGSHHPPQEPPTPLAPWGPPHRPTQDEGLIQLEGGTDPAPDLGGLLTRFQGVLAGQCPRQLLGTVQVTLSRRQGGVGGPGRVSPVPLTASRRQSRRSSCTQPSSRISSACCCLRPACARSFSGDTGLPGPGDTQVDGQTEGHLLNAPTPPHHPPASLLPFLPSLPASVSKKPQGKERQP